MSGSDPSEPVDPLELRRPRSIRLVRVRVPLVRAHVAAHGTESVRDVVLVSVTRTDGAVGWAECSTLSAPGYATGTTDAAWDALVGAVVPQALHGEHAEPDARSLATGSLAAGPLTAARGALADARLDAALRAAGASLRAWLGGATSAVPRCSVIAALGAPPEEIAERARRAVDGGAAMVKVKVEPGRDVRVIDAVRSVLGGVPVAADANGAYRDPSHLRGLDDLGLAYLEQPFAASLPIERLAELHRGLATPVALDESLTSTAAVSAALAAGAAAVVSVKAARLGGLRAAWDAVRAARSAGVDAFVGGMLELGIGRACGSAVATLPGCTLPTDLGPSASYVDQDVCEPIGLDDAGRLVVPDGAGCGRTPDESVLRRFAVRDLTFD